MRFQLGAVALAVVLVASPAHAQPRNVEDVTVHVTQRGDPARDCGCRGGVNNRSVQTDVRGNRWRCRDCRIPYRGHLGNAKVIQMSSSDRCSRHLRGPNRVRSVSGNRLLVRVSLKPIANYRFCLIVDRGPVKSFHVTARPGRPYADPNDTSSVLVR